MAEELIDKNVEIITPEVIKEEKIAFTADIERWKPKSELG